MSQTVSGACQLNFGTTGPRQVLTHPKTLRPPHSKPPSQSPARTDTGSHAAIPGAVRAGATSSAWTSRISAYPADIGTC